MAFQFGVRSAVAVGRLTDLGPREGAAVTCLRLWCDSPEGRRKVRNDFAQLRGAMAGDAALHALDEVCSLCVFHGRRAFARHGPGWQCLGADEACLANLVALATEGEREDALLIATRLVRPDFSQDLVAAAHALGLALLRGSPDATRRAATAHPERLH
jgi:hypothetical protein